ncbi:MAG TPA: YtxH domain-containing protein [Caldisericia bacterium]|nr:YtxH domain-containing protein [Caldisericia bacterium]HON83544.1 YtxH domain-containing protein [Caldisericia bacterium]HPC56227.1 YtxH domain-containing protein [Caldisericia bacterium]HRT36644.1 YtxH domain-containing protein [Caldisericia bacterium]HRU74297.1 YtxH domain-containing protein [Caldisericia bacterium]
MSEKSNNFFGGLLTGLIVGTILGILFAPAKGSETRKVIYDKGKEVVEKGKEIFGGKLIQIEEEEEEEK